MNKLQEKIKAWVISHFKHPEKMTDLDHKVLEFAIETLPQFISVIIGFSIMTFIYMFLYKKYGFERTLIILLINLVFAISEVRKAVKNLV